MRRFEDYEWYGDDRVYNPINDCEEELVKGMTKEEFEEYMERIEKRRERRKNREKAENDCEEELVKLVKERLKEKPKGDD